MENGTGTNTKTKVDPDEIIWHVAEIPITRRNAALLKRVDDQANKCAEVPDPDHAYLKAMYKKGLLYRTQVKQIFSEFSPGVAFTDFGKVVMEELKKINCFQKG